MDYSMFTPDVRGYAMVTLYQMGYERVKPGIQFGPYEREYYLIHYVVNGKGVFCAGDKKYELKQGDCFLITPGLYNYYVSDNDEPYEYYWLGFNGPKCDELVEAMGFSKDNYVIHNDEIEKLQTMFKKAIPAFGEPSIKDYLKAYEMMFAILGTFTNNTSHYKTHLVEVSLIELAVSYIENNYNKNISVNEIARYLSLSRSHTYRLFKKHYGVSVLEYITSYRISKAVNMVLQTNMSIKEIAFACGFNSEAYFSKKYKKQNGMTPVDNRNLQKRLNQAKEVENQ